MRYFLFFLVLNLLSSTAFGLEVYAKKIAFESGTPLSLRIANPLDRPIIVQIRAVGIEGKAYPARVLLQPGQDQYLRLLLHGSNSGHVRFRYQTPDGNRLGIALKAVPK